MRAGAGHAGRRDFAHSTTSGRRWALATSPRRMTGRHGALMTLLGVISGPERRMIAHCVRSYFAASGERARSSHITRQKAGGSGFRRFSRHRIASPIRRRTGGAYCSSAAYDYNKAWHLITA